MRFSVAFFCLFCSVLSALAQSPAPSAEDYSGMYSFLREGEFVQISVEDGGRISGFISRYGDSGAEQNSFIEQFFESGKLDGNHLSFSTKQIGGSSFTFDGTIERGPGKSADEEGYYVIRGTLTRLKTDTSKKLSMEKQEVEFKSFPRDAGQ